MKFDELAADLRVKWIDNVTKHFGGHYTPEDAWDRMGDEQQVAWYWDQVQKEPAPQYRGFYDSPDNPQYGDNRGIAGLVSSTANAIRTAVGMFKRWTMPELMAEPDNFEWLVGGMFADPTYGQIAGEMKSLKTYLTGFVQVGVATGLPIFGHFTPPKPRPVVAYVGEGGRGPYKRRIRRICSAMGTTPEAIDLHPTFDVAPIDSPTFQDSLWRDLDDVKPGLVTLDPLYTYHGMAAKASDLHQEGSLLNQLSAPCMDAGASLAVVNHFNQTGTGTGLKRITMAGSGEWSDTWLLVSHREQPDVDGGVFRLTLEIGSRQWGGSTWDLDLSIGRFDVDAGTHDGEITWDLNRGTGKTNDSRSDAAEARGRRGIQRTLTDCPSELTRTEIKAAVGGSREVFDRVFDRMAEDGEIAHDRAGRTDKDGRSRGRLLWGLSTSGGANPPLVADQ